jgi:hypothetical protein
MKRRDAGSGEYISPEQAETQDRNTWVAEDGKKKIKLLRKVYKRLEEIATEDVVTLAQVREVLKENGLKD